jgi:DNA mismatch repair protein MSH3
MCLIEEPQGGIGVDERVAVSMIVVSPSTGDVIWDEFNGRSFIAFTFQFIWVLADTHMRTELEVRLKFYMQILQLNSWTDKNDSH